MVEVWVEDGVAVMVNLDRQLDWLRKCLRGTHVSKGFLERSKRRENSP